MVFLWIRLSFGIFLPPRIYMCWRWKAATAEMGEDDWVRLVFESFWVESYALVLPVFFILSCNDVVMLSQPTHSSRIVSLLGHDCPEFILP
jgi:hypothetical protein